MQQEANANNELFEEQRTLDVLNGMPKDTNQEEILKGFRGGIFGGHPGFCNENRAAVFGKGTDAKIYDGNGLFVAVHHDV